MSDPVVTKAVFRISDVLKMVSRGRASSRRSFAGYDSMSIASTISNEQSVDVTSLARRHQPFWELDQSLTVQPRSDNGSEPRPSPYSIHFVLGTHD